MTNYTALVLDATTSQTRDEVVPAENATEVRRALEARGLTVLEISEPVRGLQREIPGFTKRVKLEDLAVLARIFATLLASGLNLLHTLKILSGQTANPTLKKAIEGVSDDVRAGASLSKALEARSDIFPPAMISGVVAGETGGFLDAALANVADSLEADVKLRSDIKSAATYPVVVLIMGVLAFIGMLAFIIPIFADMFANMGGELPLPTRIAVVLSDSLVWTVPLLVVGTISFSLWWAKNKNTAKVREVVDPLKLKLPVFGDLNRKIAVARMTRNLSVMLSSGVPILDALDVSAETSNNVVVARAVREASVYVRNGEPLSRHLGDGGVIPDLVIEMVGAGEQSGAMDDMLAKVATMFEQDVESVTKSLASVLEPILIVGLGAVIGSLVIAIYMPIFAVFDLVQ